MFSRSFVSTSKFFSPQDFNKLCERRVGIIGLGGVGSWAAEALARSGIKKLTLVDYDHISESNINRQVHATIKTLGKNKTDALSERLKGINPRIDLISYDEFFSRDNSEKILHEYKTDYWIDACDDLSAKIVLINSFCKTIRKKSILICGSAGGKTNPFCIFHKDLSRTEQDPMLSKLRYNLRKKYGFFRKGSMGIPAIFSTQSSHKPIASKGSKINCEGFGSIVTVTATFGMKACSIAIEQLLKK